MSETTRPAPEAVEKAEKWVREAVEDYASAWDLTTEQQNDLCGTMQTVVREAQAAALEGVAKEMKCCADCAEEFVIDALAAIRGAK